MTSRFLLLACSSLLVGSIALSSNPSFAATDAEVQKMLESLTKQEALIKQQQKMLDDQRKKMAAAVAALMALPANKRKQVVSKEMAKRGMTSKAK